MNKQLRKAIEKATRVEPIGYEVDLEVHYASHAKLLRVIELLVEQRDAGYQSIIDEGVLDIQAELDAELIAALDGEGEGT